MSTLTFRRGAGVAAGLLLALVLPAFADEEPTKAQQVQRDFLHLRTGVALYALGTGTLPASREALTKRTEQTNAALAAIPGDPWGRAYIYERLDERRFRLVCLGPDGMRGSADDVVWPRTPGKGTTLSQAKLVNLLIGALDSSDERLARECRVRLIALPRHLPGLDERLLDVLSTAARPWKMRMRCADILWQRRKVPLLEKALREGDLDTRAAALTALRKAENFQALVENDDLHIEATVRAWLRRTGDDTRGEAIALALQMRMQDAMPLIRPLLVRGKGTAGTQEAIRWRLVQAGTAVARFGDCESLPALATLAGEDPDDIVRVRSLQALQRAAFAERAPCAGRFAEGAMRALLGRALADEAQYVRMVALLLLATKKAWAAERLDTLRNILADASGREGAERRLALQALAAGGADLAIELPRRLHDPDDKVRRAAVTLLATRRPPGMAGCLIGVLAREREAAPAFHQALNGLRIYAGSLVGFPRALHADNARNRAQVQRAMQTIFAGGTALGLDRAKLVEGWLRWLCADAGLASSTGAVLTAHAAFWSAVERKDEDAARAALARLPEKARALLTHERGWLER